jgi:hypothetical protein
MPKRQKQSEDSGASKKQKSSNKLSAEPEKKEGARMALKKMREHLCCGESEVKFLKKQSPLFEEGYIEARNIFLAEYSEGKPCETREEMAFLQGKEDALTDQPQKEVPLAEWFKCEEGGQKYFESYQEGYEKGLLILREEEYLSSNPINGILTGIFG